jgi:hypothetical protein
MSLIKKAWVTDQDYGLVSLSIESENVKEKHMRVKVYEREFPEVPSERNPLRHTVVLSLFDEEDLKKILTGICKHLGYDIQGE